MCFFPSLGVIFKLYIRWSYLELPYHLGKMAQDMAKWMSHPQTKLPLKFGKMPFDIKREIKRKSRWTQKHHNSCTPQHQIELIFGNSWKNITTQMTYVRSFQEKRVRHENLLKIVENRIFQKKMPKLIWVLRNFFFLLIKWHNSLPKDSNDDDKLTLIHRLVFFFYLTHWFFFFFLDWDSRKII